MTSLSFDKTQIGKSDSTYTLDRISASTFMQYLNCPLAFYYANIAKIKLPDSSIHLLFGSSVHKAIEDMYNGIENPKESFKAMFLESELSDDDKPKFNEFYTLGLHMLDNYFEYHVQLDQLYDLKDGQSEQRFRTKIVNPLTGEMLRVPLSGILDRITVGNKIIEYKTSKDKWKTSETKFKVQCLLYNLWYYTMFGKIADETLYFVLLKRFKKTSRDEVIQVISYTPTLDELASAWEEVDLVLSKIEAGVFDRPIYGHNRFCDCYKYEKVLGIDNIT